MKKRWMIYQMIVCAVVSISLSPLGTYAHSTGSSFEREKDTIFIDIGYSTEKIRAKTPVTFDFSIFKKEQGIRSPIKFSKVWVQISDREKVIFSGSIHNNQIGGAVTTFTFPAKGLYRIKVHFQDGTDVIVEDEFAITVLGDFFASVRNILFLPILSFLSGGVVSYLLLVRKMPYNRICKAPTITR